jgi:hypothetical protein
MSSKAGTRSLLMIIAAVALAGCLPSEPDVDPNAPPPGSGPSNSAPSIAGTPNVNATVGVSYLFQPTALDADGDTLTFTATGLPGWASINAQTGLVSGMPSSTGTTGTIVVRVSDGLASASLPGFQITVSNSNTTPPNQSPTIGGSPQTNVAAGASYSFTPTASDPENGTLAFSISMNGVAGSKPSWSTFSTTTGQLSGTAQAGTYNIVIGVTDPEGASAFLSFSLTVAAGNPTGTAALSWTAPTQNTDGTPLMDLAGYRVYHGTNAGSLNDVVELQGTNTTNYTFNALASGTHYFAVSAYNASGVESALSGIGSKVIP